MPGRKAHGDAKLWKAVCSGNTQPPWHGSIHGLGVVHGNIESIDTQARHGHPALITRQYSVCWPLSEVTSRSVSRWLRTLQT